MVDRQSELLGICRMNLIKQQKESKKWKLRVKDSENEAEERKRRPNWKSNLKP